MNTSNLNHELVERIKSILDKDDVYYQIYTNRGIYTEDPTKDLDIYLDIAKQAGQEADVEKIKQGIQKRIDNGTLKVVNSYEEIEDIPGELIMKVLAFNPDLEKINAIGAELSAIPSLAISSSSRGNLEITHSDAQKGIALESIANQLNIDLKDVMALGDNLNDVSMLERVGYPVAVENAMPEVKAVAKYVTDTNENSGVGKAIMKLLKKKIINIKRCIVEMKGLIIVGSAKVGSHTNALAKYLVGQFDTHDLDVDIYDLAERPLNQLDFSGTTPSIDEIKTNIKDFQEKVMAADFLVLGTPNYHGSYSGILKMH